MDFPESEKAQVSNVDTEVVNQSDPHSGLHHVAVHGVVDNVQLFQQDPSGKVAKSKLLPRPTNDPRDPLTWPLWRKHAAFTTISYFVFLSNYITASISPILVPIVKEFNIDTTKASYLITFNILFLGLGNLFWIPLSRKIGKRPVLIVCSTIFFVANIWAAKSPSWGSLFAARIIQGFGASASEVLGPSVVADLYFLHERGARIGMFTFMIGLGSALGGVFAGLVANANPDWRWVFWMNSILTGILVLTTLLCQAETNFERPAEFEDHAGLDEPDLAALMGKGSFHWTQTLSITGWYDRQTPFWWLFVRPLTLLRYPAVVWAALTHGVILGWVVLQQTGNSIFLPAIYHFSELAVGNVNVANVVGGVLGCLVGGYASDWVSVYISKRRKGYFKPELRLWCLIPSFIFGPVGVLLWGFGFGKHLSSMTVVAGTGITYGVLCAASATSMTYVIDCYRPVAGEVVTILVAFRNTFAFGFSFAVVPWIEGDGFIKVSGYMTLIEGLIFLLAVPMYILGPRFRHWTSKFVI